MILYTFVLLFACASQSTLAWSLFGGSSKGLGPSPLTHMQTVSSWRHKRNLNDVSMWKKNHDRPKYTPPWNVYIALLVAYSPSLSQPIPMNDSDRMQQVVEISTLLNTEAGTLFVSAMCPLARDNHETGGTEKRRESDAQLLERELIRSIREYAHGKGPPKF